MDGWVQHQESNSRQWQRLRSQETASEVKAGGICAAHGGLLSLPQHQQRMHLVWMYQQQHISTWAKVELNSGLQVLFAIGQKLQQSQRALQ